LIEINNNIANMLRELGELEEDNETSNISMKLRNLQMKSMGLMDSLCFQATIEVIIDFSFFISIYIKH